MDVLSLEEILQSKSKEFVLAQVSEILESKKSAILNRDQVILNWILTSIYKNVSKKSNLQKSKVPFIMDVRVWSIFSKVIEKRKDFSIDMALLKGIGVMCSATMPTSPHVSCVETQIDSNAVDNKVQIIELCADIMDKIFKFSNNYWPSVENYAIFFVSVLPSVLDTFHSNANIDDQLLTITTQFLNACCIHYINLLNISRYEKRYQSTLKFIEFLLPLYKYFSEEQDNYKIERVLSASIIDSLNKIIQESFFPLHLHVSDTTKLIEDYSNSLMGNDKNNKNLSTSLISKINESIKKYHSSLNVFPIILSSFIQFIQQYRSVVDTLSTLNLQENLESLQFMFFKELLAAVSDQLLKEGTQTLSIQQLNVIEKMLKIISKYNIYNSRNNKHIGSISNLIDSTYSALLTHSSSSVVFNILIEISNLDYSLLEPKLDSIFSLAFQSQNIHIVESVLIHFLILYSKLRQFERFFQTLLTSMSTIDANLFLSCYQFSQCFTRIAQEIPVGQIQSLCVSFQSECQKSWQNSRDFIVISHLYSLFLNNIPISKANAQTIYDFICNSNKDFISAVHNDIQMEDMKHLVLLSLYFTFVDTVENCLNYLPYSLQDNIFNWESSDERSLLTYYVEEYLMHSKQNYSNSMKYIFCKFLIRRIYYSNWSGNDETSSNIYLALFDMGLSSISNSNSTLLELPNNSLSILQEIHSISCNSSYFHVLYWKLIVDNIEILLEHLPTNYCRVLLGIILSNFGGCHDNKISINSINAQLLGNSSFYEFNKFRDIFVSVLVSKLNQTINTIPSLPLDVKECLSTLQSNTIDDFPNVLNTILNQDIILVDSTEFEYDNVVSTISDIIKLLYSIPISYFPRTDQCRILQMMLILERVAIVPLPSMNLINTLALSRKIIYNILTIQPSLKKIIPVQSTVWLIQSHINQKLPSLGLLKQSVDLLSSVLTIHSIKNIDLMKYFKKLHKETRQHLAIQQTIMSAVLQWLAQNSTSFRKNEGLFTLWAPYLNRVKKTLFKSIHQCDTSINTSFYLESISLLLILYNDVLGVPLSDSIISEAEDIVSGILRLPWINIPDASASEKHSILIFLKSIIKMKSNLSKNTVLQLVHIILSLLDIFQYDKDTYNNLLSLFSLLMSGISNGDNSQVTSLFNYQLAMYDFRKFNIVLDCVNVFLPTLKDNNSSTKFKYQLLLLIMTKSMQLNYQIPQNLESTLLLIQSIIKNLNVYYVDSMLTNLNMTSSSLLSPASFLIYSQILIILITEQPEYCFKCAASYVLSIRALTMRLSSIVEKAENKISCLECVARLYQIISSYAEFADYFIYMIADYLEFVENYHFVDTNLISIQRSVFELMARSDSERLDHLNTILSPSNKVNFRKLYNQFQRDFMFKPDML